MRSIDVVWGVNGLRRARTADTCVIVDVLSFSSAVDAACSRGAVVYPYEWHDERVHAYADSVDATVAVQRQDAQYCRVVEVAAPSLSPPSLLQLPAGYRLVLPSPNGSTLAALSQAATTVAGCLRNAGSVAGFLNRASGDIVVVAAGERWPDGSLRPALEDLIGAGAIVTLLTGCRSADAAAAVAVYATVKDNLVATLQAIPSGTELVERGFGVDVEFAALLNVSTTVPVLAQGRFQADEYKRSGQSG